MPFDLTACASDVGRHPHSARAYHIHPLAVVAAAAVHSTVLLLLLCLGHLAPPKPAPAVAVALEILPAPTEATAASPSDAVSPPLSLAEVSPSPPDAANSLAPQQVETSQDKVVAAMLEPPAAIQPTPDRVPPDATASPSSTTVADPQPDNHLPEFPPSVEAVSIPPPSAQVRPSPLADVSLPPVPHPPSTKHPARRPPAERTDPQAVASPGPGSDATPPPAASAASINSSWQSQLSAWLQAHKEYPEAARARGEEGTVAVSFTVARDGHVLAVSLAHGSGSERLDTAALLMLHDARVPEFPPIMSQGEVTVVVSLHYTLRR